MVSWSYDPRPPRGESGGRRDDRTTIVCMDTSRRPGTTCRHCLAQGGERSPLDMMTAVEIDAKLELVDERSRAQPEVMT
jgi:hypothetical protein